MHCKRMLPIAVLLLATMPIAAQDKPRSGSSRSAGFDNRHVFGPGTHTLAAPIIIPQTNSKKTAHGTWPYANPTDKIAGVFGIGATTSILRVPLAVAKQGAFITTEDYGKRPVYTAIVRGLSIVGPGDWDMGQFPCINTKLDAIPEEATAVRLDAIESIVDDCSIRLVRGPAISFRHSASSGYWLMEYRASNNRIMHCFTGIRACTDGRYNDNIIAGCRDYCLEVPQNAGAVQSTGNHYYGATKAIYVHNAEAFHSTNDVFSDATEYGLHLTGYSHNALVTNGFSQHCNLRNVKCDSNFLSMMNCTIRVANEDDDRPDIAGLEISGRGFQFIGGHVYLSGHNYPGSTHDVTPRGSTAFLFSNDKSYNGDCRDAYVRTTIVSGTFQEHAGSNNHETALHYLAPGIGHDIELTIPAGFELSNARLLVIDDTARAGMKNCQITFRGADLGAAVANPESFIDIGAGGIDSSNVVTIIDTSSGDGATNKAILQAGTTY